MAEESRPPPDERPSALPRRVPGAGGLTPGQVRRGYLPGGKPAAAAERAAESAAPPDAPREPRQRPGGELPRRAPGTSPIQSPPPFTRRRVLPGRSDRPVSPGANGDADTPLATLSERASVAATKEWLASAPSPAALASSAASLLRGPTAQPIPAAAGPVRPLAEPPAHPEITAQPPGTAAPQASAAPPVTTPPPVKAQPLVTPPSVRRAAPTAPMPGRAAPAPAAAPPAPAAQRAPAGSGAPPGPGILSPSGTPPAPAPIQPSPAARPGGKPKPTAKRAGNRKELAKRHGGRAQATADTASPARPARPSDRTRTVRPAQRWRLAGLVIAMVLVIAALAALAARRGSTPGPRPPAAAGSQRIAAEAAARSLAVTWVTGQVGRDVIVACDAVTCSDLAQHKFPAGNLTVLQATTPDPYGSSLVIATADIRSQFGSKLSSVYAPEVIASFGSGSDRIDIRVIAAGGPAEFQAALSKDLAVRKSSGAPLLRTNRIALSPSARTEIAAGHVDMRLITTIAFLAAMHPVDVVGFAGAARGADPDVPLRIAYLAQADASARLNTAAYVRALTDLVHAQQPPYVAQSVRTVRLPDGQAVLEIEFAAPSPLGLP